MAKLMLNPLNSLTRCGGRAGVGEEEDGIKLLSFLNAT